MLQSSIAIAPSLANRLGHDTMSFRLGPNPALLADQFAMPVAGANPTPAPMVSNSNPEVVAHLFGKFSTTINGHPVTSCHSYAGWSMFAYLLAHSRVAIPVDVLESIFWPEASTYASRNNRNVAMSHLRHTLRAINERPIIEHRGGKYQFARDCTVWTDVQEFEQRLNTGRWLEANHRIDEAMLRYESALSLYESDFLADELYQDWVLRKRDELRSLYVDTLDRLSKFYFERSNFSACIDTCRRILARDRWREDVHCLLMHCFARQNQLCFALKQYRDCVEALRQEFNLAPSAETLQLHERLLRREWV